MQLCDKLKAQRVGLLEDTKRGEETRGKGVRFGGSLADETRTDALWHCCKRNNATSPSTEQHRRLTIHEHEGLDGFCRKQGTTLPNPYRIPRRLIGKPETARTATQRFHCVVQWVEEPCNAMLCMHAADELINASPHRTARAMGVN